MLKMKLSKCNQMFGDCLTACLMLAIRSRANVVVCSANVLNFLEARQEMLYWKENNQPGN